MIVSCINFFPHIPVPEHFVEKFSSWTQERSFYPEVVMRFESKTKSNSPNYHIGKTLIWVPGTMPTALYALHLILQELYKVNILWHQLAFRESGVQIS